MASAPDATKPVPDDRSLDLLGWGKMAEAIPDESWNTAVVFATEQIEKLLSPLTEGTSGIARLIRGTCRDLEDWRKLAFAPILERAARIAREAKSRPTLAPNPRVLITVIEEGSKTLEPELRELWANLLAREFTVGGVLPEIPAR